MLCGDGQSVHDVSVVNTLRSTTHCLIRPYSRQRGMRLRSILAPYAGCAIAEELIKADATS